jgi:hypothetical protein
MLHFPTVGWKWTDTQTLEVEDEISRSGRVARSGDIQNREFASIEVTAPPLIYIHRIDGNADLHGTRKNTAGRPVGQPTLAAGPPGRCFLHSRRNPTRIRAGKL